VYERQLEVSIEAAMSEIGHDRSFGEVGSMSGLPESGHGWPIYEYTP
jgi:hypothetical protein